MKIILKCHYWKYYWKAMLIFCLVSNCDTHHAWFQGTHSPRRTTNISAPNFVSYFHIHNYYLKFNLNRKITFFSKTDDRLNWNLRTTFIKLIKELKFANKTVRTSKPALYLVWMGVQIGYTFRKVKCFYNFIPPQ